MGVILLWVCVFPRESQNPILVAQLAGCASRRVRARGGSGGGGSGFSTPSDFGPGRKRRSLPKIIWNFGKTGASLAVCLQI
eukprot:SAG25_NODE_22_length_22323_cov_52.926874_7_plen_81_part_00